jgi:N-acetylneuraminic acid mutarotase
MTVIATACGRAPEHQGSLAQNARPAPATPSEATPQGHAWKNLGPGWTELPPPPGPRSDAVSVWTAREGAVELLVWGGYTEYGASVHADGFAWSSQTNQWRRLPEAPLAPRYQAGTVFTGSEVMVWGGYGSKSEPLGDGAAYNPATDSWRSIGEAPISARAPLSTVWTGEEMIVWGSYDRPSGHADGAAYDPSRNRWRPIARAPRALNLATTVWTGDEMIVFGALLDNNNASRTDHAVGLAYDPGTNSWRELPSTHLSPQASATAWTGKEVIAWDYELHAAAYDPNEDRWRALPDVPLRFYECYPASVAIGSFVMAWYCGDAALWDFLDGGWRRIRTPNAVVPGYPVGAGEVVLFAGATHESKHNSLWAYAPPPD